MQNCGETGGKMSFGGALFSPITFGDVAKLGFNLARACLVNWVELIFVIRRVRSFGLPPIIAWNSLTARARSCPLENHGIVWGPIFHIIPMTLPCHLLLLEIFVALTQTNCSRSLPRMTSGSVALPLIL